jgi:TusA-related sulfurtransferase
MEKEKVLVIEDLPGAIENIEKFYKEYYPKTVELEIITNLKDAEEKIQDITSNKTL